MPELPEVETIKNGLAERIVGKTIRQVLISNQKSFLGKPTDIENKKVTSLERRAKLIRIRLENNKNLLFHLKMTGQLIFCDRQNRRIAGGHPSHDWHADLPNKYTRIEFIFNNNDQLFFNDLRKFGWCKVLTDHEVKKIFNQFGPEPFSAYFNPDYLLSEAVKKPKRTIKQFLMDQSIIAGIGNIYNDESLFLSKVNPRTPVNKLTKKDWLCVKNNVLIVLKKGIKYGGTTDSDFVNAEGKKGGMQEHLNAYHQTGKPCPNKCGDTIKRIKLGGRGTYYCPTCQKDIK